MSFTGEVLVRMITEAKPDASVLYVHGERPPTLVGRHFDYIVTEGVISSDLMNVLRTRLKDKRRSLIISSSEELPEDFTKEKVRPMSERKCLVDGYLACELIPELVPLCKLLKIPHEGTVVIDLNCSNEFGREAYRSPEFKTFCEAAGIPWDLRTRSIRIIMQKNHLPEVEHTYVMMYRPRVEPTVNPDAITAADACAVKFFDEMRKERGVT